MCQCDPVLSFNMRGFLLALIGALQISFVLYCIVLFIVALFLQSNTISAN